MVAVAGLGAAQVQARWQYRTRGWVPAGSGGPEPLDDTPDAALCVNAALEQYAPPQLAEALDQIEAGGYAWVRQRFAWSAIEPAPGAFDWARWDALVAEARARDLRIIAVLDSAPDWAGTPPDPAAFARFAATLAGRYAHAVRYYQIWHNPNLGDAWGGRADVHGYAALLAAAATAIRDADPDARILLGSLAPNVEVRGPNYAEDVFLDMLYDLGAQAYFDVVAVQPYGFSSPPGDRRVGRDVFNFSRAVWVREALLAHGAEATAVWASHIGWNSKPPQWPGPPSIWGAVDPATQARYTVAALERATREWPWMGVLCVNGFQPRPEAARAVPDAEEHWGFALVGPEGAPRPVYRAVQAWAAGPRRATPGTYRADTSLATYTGAWTLGPRGADIGQSGDAVTLPFTGTAVALTVRRGPYRAFLFVTVDGEPAPALPRDRKGRAYVVLYDPLAAVATVPLAHHLPAGPHTVEVVAERGWGQWALADWRVAHAPDRTPYRRGLAAFGLLGLLGAVLAGVAGRHVDWGALGRGAAALWRRLRAGVRAVLSVVVGAVYLFAAWHSIGQGGFRRLGEGGEVLALVLAGGVYYVSPWLLLTLGAGVGVSLIVALEPSLGLMLTMFAAPLYMHPLSLLGKSFSLAELVLLPTLVGCALAILPRRMRGTDNRTPDLDGPGALSPVPFGKPILGLVLIAAVSALFAAHRREALRELRLVVLEPALFYVALVTLPMRRRERWRIVDAFVLSAVLVAGVGLAQYAASFCRGAPLCDGAAGLLGEVITAEGGMRRLRSIYGSPNNVGLYLGRALPLVLAVVLWGDAARVRRGLYAGALAAIGAALLLSLSRGAIVLGVPAALLTLGMLAGKAWRRATFLVLLLGVLALIPLMRTPRFAGMFDLRAGTTGFRVSLWYSSLRMVRDHPLLGVGPDNFLYAYRTRYVLPTAWEQFDLSHPHNVVLDFATRLGLPGVVAFAALQIAFWRRALSQYRDRRRRALVLGAMGVMANFLGHGLVDASYFVIDLAFVFYLTLALVVWAERAPSAGSTLPPPG
jgi:O-antigen ligase